MIAVFLWLLAVILWSAICVVRHADCLAIKLGEPYGTLILTLSAICIEVVMISTAIMATPNARTVAIHCRGYHDHSIQIAERVKLMFRRVHLT